MNPTIPDDAPAAFDHDLARADEEAAVALSLSLLQDGVSAQDILLDLIAPAQVAVGARWAAAEWTVAREHAATHVSERATSAVATLAHPRRTRPGEVVVACTDGEWHTLPARILTEVLRLHGFRVRFLGGDVPADQLVADLHRNAPDIVALSCILTQRLPLAHRLVQVCQLAGVPVLAGGPGFGPDGTWAVALGADLYAPDAARAADVLAGSWPPPLTGTSTVSPAAIEAYAQLTRDRPRLLRHLRDAYPDCPDADDTLGHLLDALAAAVFVDDPRVATGQLVFTTSFLTARGADPAGLGPVLDTLTAHLAATPTAVPHLDAARRHLARAR